MINLTKYLSTFIPPFIEVGNAYYAFQIFINMPHNDIRLGYADDENGTFLYIYEEIGTDDELHVALIDLRNRLRENGYLKDEYATEEGYTYEKYKKTQS